MSSDAKKAATAYQFFLKDKLVEMRENLKNENKDCNESTCIKELKKIWKSMNSQERKVYI